jgi:hypothetical protein
MTPSLAIIHVQNPHWRGIKLWIPLFLLWIPVILLSPLLLLVVLAMSIARGMNPLRVVKIFWDIVCGLPGTDVRVTADGNRVLVRIL